MYTKNNQILSHFQKQNFYFNKPLNRKDTYKNQILQTGTAKLEKLK